MSEDETDAVASARETRDLVLAAVLQLAKRAIDHVEEHDVAHVVLAERIPGGGFYWDLRAGVGKGHSFVSVNGTPRPSGGPVVCNMAELAAVMENESAQFSANVPRAWIELAIVGERASDAGTLGSEGAGHVQLGRP